jgi:MSHA biogenesis protein MshP
MNRQPRAESGFVLPTAIFLLVVLAALASYMVSLSRTSHISSALDIQGARAYQAARAGIEWAAWQAIQNPVPSCVAAPPPLILPPFSVDVSCVPSVPYNDGADVVVVYQVTSTATSGLPGEVDFVQRRIEASFSK